MSQSVNILKKRIGIIGGGQLGKMMILDAKRLGFYVVILDPTEFCPAHSIADEHIIAAFDDLKAFEELANTTDVITYEFEHIGIQALKVIENSGHVVYPTVHSLEVIQNKLTQKNDLKHKKIPVPNFKGVTGLKMIQEAADEFGYPLMLKACQGGYDGKGNAIIKDEKSIRDAIFSLGGSALYDAIKNEQLSENILMVEAFVDYALEISVLACRGIDGSIVVYPVAENHHKDSILDETIVPAAISEGAGEEAMALAKSVMEIFQGVGMFCVEMFITKENQLFINEVAPRPHNSGHYTIEGCLTSQFEQHIRAITGLPFGEVTLRNHTVMKNLLGETDSEGEVSVIGIESAYQHPQVKIHIYGKAESKPKRKMGHLTVCASSRDEALKIAREAYNQIHIIGDNPLN